MDMHIAFPDFVRKKPQRGADSVLTTMVCGCAYSISLSKFSSSSTPGAFDDMNLLKPSYTDPLSLPPGACRAHMFPCLMGFLHRSPVVQIAWHRFSLRDRFFFLLLVFVMFYINGHIHF
jgi:hypothetical protein